MSLLVNFTPLEETLLSNVAMQSGLAPEELVRKLVSEYLPIAAMPTPVALPSLEEMRRRIRKWQAEDHTPILSPLPARPGLTPTAVLFQQWEEEDAHKTDEEVAANDRLWLEYQQGINEERTKAGMRLLF